MITHSWVLRKGNFISSLNTEQAKPAYSSLQAYFESTDDFLRNLCVHRENGGEITERRSTSYYLHHSSMLISFLIYPAYRSWCNCPEIHYGCNWNLLQNCAFLTECLLTVTVKFQNFTSVFYCLSCIVNRMLKSWLSPQVCWFCNDSNKYHITQYLLICLHRHENLWEIDGFWEKNTAAITDRCVFPCSAACFFIIIIYMLFPSYMFPEKHTFLSTWNHASVASHLIGIYGSWYYMT